MRLISLAVVTLLTGCNTVDETCDAGDVDCWFEHLEVTSEGLEVERFPGRTITGGGAVVPTAGNISRDALLWAVGEGGLIVVDDDRQGWLRQDSGITSTLSSVWAAANNDVWAGGAGELLHYDGVSWKHVADPVTVSAISGSGPDDVWFATGPGGLVHFDGAGFATVDTGFPDQLLSVWVAAAGDVWAGGFAGALLHWSGGQWARVQSGTSNDVRAIHGLSPNDVYLAAGQLMRGGTGGFTEVRADFGANALHANAGQLWAIGTSARFVRGSPPSFADGETSRPGNGVYFDGAQAFAVEAQGQIEVVRADGISIGATSVGAQALLAIHGVAQPRATSTRPTIVIEGNLDGGLEFEPGEQKKLTISYDDPCGATPGICMQVCSGSTRCSSGVICTRQKPDGLVKGRFTLGVRYSAAPRPEEEPLQALIGVLDCGCSGCRQELANPDEEISFGATLRFDQFLLPLPDTQSATGGGSGGSSGAGGGGGSNTCDHCVTGQRCSACGSGTACGGKTCCAAGETCVGTTCRSSPTSGHSLITIQECGATARYTVRCSNGGCCPTCTTCNSDGTCSLP